MLRHLVQRLAHPAARAARLEPIQHAEHGVHVLGRRRHMLDDLTVERHETDAVALAMDQVRQAGSQNPGVIELRDAAAAVVHRLRHVEQHREVHVRLGFVLLDVVAVGPRPDAPIHPANIVTGHVPTMLGEINRRAEVRRLVQAVDEAVAHRSGHEVQVPDTREHNGIHEARAGNGGRRVCAQQNSSPIPSYMPERGSGTAASSRSTRISVVMPSDCAWKLVMILCRSTGCVSARTSSKLT